MVRVQTGERETIVIDLAEHRLNRQLRSAFAATTDHPGPHKSGPVDAMVVLTWRKVSPSAHLMVDPRNGARAVIRNTGAADTGRFLWSVLAAGEMDPLSEGRTDDLAQAQSMAEAALCAYAEINQHGWPGMLRRSQPERNPRTYSPVLV
jgi:hypothetical protein